MNSRFNKDKDMPYARVIEGEQDTCSRVKKGGKRKSDNGEKISDEKVNEEVEVDEEDTGHRIVRMGRDALDLPHPNYGTGNKKNGQESKKGQGKQKKMRRGKKRDSSESDSSESGGSDSVDDVSSLSQADVVDSSVDSSDSSDDGVDVSAFADYIDTIHWDPQDRAIYKVVHTDVYDPEEGLREIVAVRSKLTKAGTWAKPDWDDTIRMGDIIQYTKNGEAKVEKMKSKIKEAYKELPSDTGTLYLNLHSLYLLDYNIYFC